MIIKGRFDDKYDVLSKRPFIIVEIF